MEPAKELIILGTGIHSLEMVEILERINNLDLVWRLRGFLSPGGIHRLRIGADSTVGMGAVVIRDVPPHAVMAGNPARVLRMKAV